MRPNIDLDWSLHGDVKELAEDEGISIGEAYEDVIAEGIRNWRSHFDKTIGVSRETYTALDRLRDEEESFDSIIRRVVDQGTDVTVETFSKDLPNTETGEVEPIPDDVEPGAGCAHYEVVGGEECGNPVEYRQKYRFADGGDWKWFYYCTEHAPDV